MHDMPPAALAGCLVASKMHSTELGVRDAAMLAADACLLPLCCQVTFLSGFDEDGEPLKRSMQEVGTTLGVSPQR